MKKRVCSLLLCLVLTVCLLPVSAFAGDEQDKDAKVTVNSESRVDTLSGNTITTVTTITEGDGYIETLVEITETDPEGEVISCSGYIERRELVLEPLPEIPALELEFIPVEEGQTASDSSGAAEPEISGDIKEGDDDEIYDQTTVTETPREAHGSIAGVQSSQGSSPDAPELQLESIQPEWTGEEQDMNVWDTEFRPSGEAPEGYSYYYSGYTGDSYYGIKYINDGKTDYGDVIQFVLKDPVSGEELAAYCLDMSTGTRDGWWYDVQNLEDADYYTDEEAEHLRAIALNGYWGTAEGTGSLQSMKQLLGDALAEGHLQGISQEEIDSLSEGEAMVATQLALWMYGNRLEGETEFYGSNFNGTGEDGSCDINATEQDKEAWRRMEHIASYLAGLKETAGDSTELLNPDKFLESISLVLGDKAQGFDSNLDEDDSNDIYDASLDFVLQVTVGENDELYISIIDPEGNVLKNVRLMPAGTAAGEDSISPRDDGSYRIEGLQLQEGELDLTLELQGAQYLEQGVYIYSSEIRNNLGAQTFVGIAEGYEPVELEMSVTLDFGVDEGHVSTERLMRTQWKSAPDSTHGESPKTGDDMLLWLSLSVFSGVLLVFVIGRRKKNLWS